MATILLMEDDDDLREGLKRALVQHGHAVADEGSGDGGMRVLQTLVPDLVITDIIMDDGEGIGTIMQIHASLPDLPVIAISGNPMYLQHGLKLGARHALLKPFQIRELIMCVEDCLAQRRDACA